MGRQSGYNLSRLHRRSLVMHRRPGIHTISAGLSSVASSRLLTQTRRRADGESPIRPQRGLADAPRHICYDTLASKSRRYRDYTPKRQFGPRTGGPWLLVVLTACARGRIVCRPKPNANSSEPPRLAILKAFAEACGRSAPLRPSRETPH